MLWVNCMGAYVRRASISYDPLFQDQNYPIRPWNSLISIGFDRWGLNKSDFSECIERMRWKYPILVCRIGGVEFDRAELYTFDSAYMYLICTYLIPQCKLGRECQDEDYNTCLLYFYQTLSHFSRFHFIQLDCMIPISDAFINENAELLSCFMASSSQSTTGNNTFVYPILLSDFRL